MCNYLPPMGFGTYGRTGGQGVAAIRDALGVGYRHLDTAQDYGTEWEVGEALRQSGLNRDEVFLTTKVATGNFGPGQVIPSLQHSLAQLQIEQLDLALIHWPAPDGALPLAVYFEQLLEAQQLGLTRLIGVSNFTIALLQAAEALAGAQVIATNQIELNPWFQNRRVADYCHARGIQVTCYQPIAQGRYTADPVLGRVAARHAASVEQVALAFELHKGYAVIPTSARLERIRSLFAAQDIELTQDDMNEISSVTQGERSIDPPWGPTWD